MARNLFYRDFTSAKAVLLAGLLVVAALMGEVPHVSAELDGVNEAAPERVIPVLWFQVGDQDKDCDNQWLGIAL